MNLDRIREESVNTYLNYSSYCDNVGIGLCDNYDMLKAQILEHHNRVITYDMNKMLYSTYIDNKKKITCKTREGLEDKLVNFYLQNCSGLYYFNQVFERALLYNKENDFLAPSSIDRYRVDYLKYLDNSEYFNQDIRCISESDILSFFSELMKEKPTAKVVSNVKTVIRLVFSYARIQEKVECLHVTSVFNEMHFPQRAFAPKKVVENRVFKDDHMNTLFEHLNPDDDVELGIKLCFYTGLRVGELCALRVSDVDFTRRILFVSRAETVHGYGKERIYEDSAPKCYKERCVVLSQKAVDILNHLICFNRTGFLFPDGEGHKHAHVFNSRIRRLCKKIGLPVFSMHDIRRTYASKLLDSEVTENFVKDQLGHSDIRTTRQYYYYSTSKEEEYLKFADISAI